MKINVMARVVCLLLALQSFAPFQAQAATITVPGHNAKIYSLAVIPFYAPEKMWQLYTPFVQYLNSATGLTWELKLYHDHESFINGLCSGDVDIAFMGPVPLGRINGRCGIGPFLVALGKDGRPFYRSIIITSNPAVTSLKQLRGRKFGLFRGSTAAHILPVKMLRDAGLDLKSVGPVFLESQDRIMTALLEGEISAAGIKESLYKKFANEPLKVLSVSDALPNFAFAASASLPIKTRETFASALLALHPLSNAEDAAKVRMWDDEIKNGFVVPDKSFLPAVLKLHKIYEEVTSDKR